MSKIDSVREEIGWLKLVFGLLVAINASLIAWLFQNYAIGNKTILLGALSMTVILIGAKIWLNRLVYKHIRELEDL